MLLSLVLYYKVYDFNPHYQWIVLLISSLIFYSCCGIENLLFILISSFSTWMAGLYFSKLFNEFKQIKQSRHLNRDELKRYKANFERKKRIILLLVVVLNLGILGCFKYASSLLSFLGISFLPLNQLLIPLGISFYTFQSLGYLFDTYHGKYNVQTSYPKYLLFVSYFPQLIQGPINRFDLLGIQFDKPHPFDIENVKRALLLFAFGALKKYAIADLLVNSISVIFDSTSPQNITGAISVFGILLYSIQQYADFSGGIDMVLSLSQLFGIQMSPNFRQPYFATSLADFWRRWHISLGAWMRDYVFYPFALTKPMQRLHKRLSSKHGKRIAGSITGGLANILVFFLVGIWHGAQLHYIAWGLYNGIIIAVSELLQPLFNRLTSQFHLPIHSKAFYLFRIIRTFIIVNIGWYFDRIESITSCFVILKCTFLNFSLSSFFSLFSSPQYADISTVSIMLALLSCTLLFAHSILAEQKIDVYAYIHQKHIVLRWLLYTIVFFLIVLSFVFTTSQEKGFMYANF